MYIYRKFNVSLYFDKLKGSLNIKLLSFIFLAVNYSMFALAKQVIILNHDISIKLSRYFYVNKQFKVMWNFLTPVLKHMLYAGSSSFRRIGGYN